MKPSHAAKIAVLAALAGAAALSTPGPAAASTSQLTIMEDDAQTVVVDDARRAKTLNDMKSLGADIVKIRVRWRDIAPGATKKHKPSGFNGNNPNDYPTVNWNWYDASVRAIVARGMQPYLSIGGPAPRWASHDFAGVKRPSASEFKKFAHAVGTRYSGSFVRDGQALPRVTIWSFWNEGNLVSWLAPQYSGQELVAPRIYRLLVEGGHEGLAASGHGSDQILFGELLPFARPGQESVRIRPITFLREMACVDGSYHPYKGSAAKAHGCQNFHPIPGTGFAYHPYTFAGGPDIPTPNHDEATISNLGRVLNALDRLSNAHRFVVHRLPIWVTEFGFQTDPPDPYATDIKKVPGFLGEAEWLAYRNPRVASYAQYPLVDDKPDANGGGFQSGLRTYKRKAKPGVYKAFKLPLFVKKRSKSVVEVFGGIRPGSPGEQLTIESRLGHGSWKAVPGGTVTLNSQQYFDRVVSLSSAAKRHYRFTFAGGKSRAAGVHS